MLRAITPSDLLDAANYARTRATFCRDIGVCQRLRRIEVGPLVTLHFENYATLWLQVQERLHSAAGGAAQIPEALAAFNPLLPQGEELVAVVATAEADRQARPDITLAGIVATAFIRIGAATIGGVPAFDADCSGIAEPPPVLRFPFTPDEIAAFREGTADIMLGFLHPRYQHVVAIGDAVREELAEDFD